MPDEPSPPARPSGSSGNRRRRRPSGGGSGSGQRAGGQKAPAQRGSSPRGTSQKAQGSSRSRGGGSRGGATQARRRGPDGPRGTGAAAVIPSASELAERSPVQMAGAGLRHAVAANRRRARTVAGAPGAVLLVVGAVIGLAAGAVALGVVAGAAAGVALSMALWRGATAMVLRALGARTVDEDDVPGPWTQVEGLCASMGLGVPDLYLVDDRRPNALAVGRGPEDSALVLTAGLLDTLDPVALEGVLAHELSHVKANDVAPATLAAAVAVASGAGRAGAGIVHRLAGRGREFEADRHAVGVTRYPPGLRQALDAMASWDGRGGALAGGRAAQAARWLFTVVLPDAEGGRPTGADVTGELDAPAVRIAALDEW